MDLMHSLGNEFVGHLEEPEIKFPTSAGSLREQESSRKTSISALLTMPKPLTVWITATYLLQGHNLMYDIDSQRYEPLFNIY